MVAPEATPKKYERISPLRPENKAIKTDKKVYCLMFFAIFLEAAAGNTSIELIIIVPTHCIESVTITATTSAKTYSQKRTETPLLFARDGLRLTKNILLKAPIHNMMTPIKVNTSNTRS